MGDKMKTINENLFKIKIVFISLLVVISFVIIGGSNYLRSKSNINKQEYQGLVLGESVVRELNYKKETQLYNDWKIKSEQTLEIKPSVIEGTVDSIPVLTYHGITDEDDGENITLEKFRQQLYVLKREGYVTIGLHQLKDFLEKGKSLPNKSIMITFDDGRKDSFYNADPVLAAVNYNAVMFLIVSRMSDFETFHLARAEIKFMLATGRWEIGSHSFDAHKEIVVNESGEKGFYFGNKQWLVSDQRLETDAEFKNRISSDMARSISVLEDEFGMKVDTFAYPFGDFGQNSRNYENAENVIKELSKKYFHLSFYQYWGSGNAKNYPVSDAFFVKRISVTPEVDSSMLLDLID